MLVDGPDYGSRLTERLGGEWSSGAVYGALRRLRQRGLIEPARAPADADARMKRYYRATESGKRANAARVARASSDPLTARERTLVTRARVEVLSIALETPIGRNGAT
ncbi:MAG TPA: helix-turn-helix transcriptional regulator [Solirubrobacteraceae bacterium]|nr:helix-turn-helix transcriptional regulator [Solirubrobacteraceae bacterium]